MWSEQKRTNDDTKRFRCENNDFSKTTKIHGYFGSKWKFSIHKKSFVLFWRHATKKRQNTNCLRSNTRGDDPSSTHSRDHLLSNRMGVRGDCRPKINHRMRLPIPPIYSLNLPALLSWANARAVNNPRARSWQRWRRRWISFARIGGVAAQLKHEKKTATKDEERNLELISNKRNNSLEPSILWSSTAKESNPSSVILYIMSTIIL